MKEAASTTTCVRSPAVALILMLVTAVVASCRDDAPGTDDRVTPTSGPLLAGRAPLEVQVSVTSREWRFSHSDSTCPGLLVVPTGRQVRLSATSGDLFHQLLVVGLERPRRRESDGSYTADPAGALVPSDDPAAAGIAGLITVEAIPGSRKEVRFHTQHTGTYELQCMEKGAVGHAPPRMELHVVSPQSFERWLRRGVCESPHAEEPFGKAG